MSYAESLVLNKGRESSKKKWIEDARVFSLEFLCKDAFIGNNAWYKFSCGHIKSINIADVRRGKFGCSECRADKYESLCKDKGLEYISHYCEDTQTFIKTKCMTCGTLHDHRASSITHHETVICESCKQNRWTETAKQYGFVWKKRIDGYFSVYDCELCGREDTYRISDIGKGEVACQCKREKYLAEISKWASDQGFELIEKLDHTWSTFKCNYCNHEDRFQQQAMKIGNVRCSSCNPNKSNRQKQIEEHLKDLGYVLTTELTFDDLRGFKGGKLRYDIAFVQGKQVKWIIEFDGLQHFRPVSFSKSGYTEESMQSRYEYIKKHDSIKNDYAKNKGIPLLRIAYNDSKWKSMIGSFLG